MNDTLCQQKRRPLQFTVRGLLVLMLLVALALAWRSSLERAERKMAEQENRLQFAEEELQRARDELFAQSRRARDNSRVLWAPDLEGINLRGVTIASQENAFQRAYFSHCNLENAVLQGGDSAFQQARFDGAKLIQAQLKGGNASFQSASFVSADLAGAVLEGVGSAFQRSSFENANLSAARLAGSFQVVNISGACFAGADLSALNSSDLASCYFKDPPIYDEQTRFPTGFDPQARRWRRAAR